MLGGDDVSEQIGWLLLVLVLVLVLATCFHATFLLGLFFGSEG
jgi:hypothetical protein